MSRSKRTTATGKLMRWAATAGVMWLLDPTQGAARRARLATAGRELKRKLAPKSSAAPGDPTPIRVVIDQFARRGQHLVDHEVSDVGDVVCGACGTPSAPGAMTREWRHRLEGATDPADMTSLSGLRCPACGALGLLALRYGPEADSVEADVLVRLAPPETDDLRAALQAYPTVPERVRHAAERGATAVEQVADRLRRVTA